MLHTSYLLLLKRRAVEPEPEPEPEPLPGAGAGAGGGASVRRIADAWSRKERQRSRRNMAAIAYVLALVASGEMD